MKKKKYVDSESYITDSGIFEFSHPFKDDVGCITSHLQIDLSDLIDWYDYHDAPSNVELWLGKDKLIELRDLLNLLLNELDKLEN